MERLTKQSEQRLLDIVSEVASNIADGETPNDAIVKAAETHKLQTGLVRLVVQAVNTGAFNAHRKSAETNWEKAADFPIANAEAVIERLYPTEIKTAKQRSKEAISDEYSKAPVWIKELAQKEAASKEPQAAVVKQASVRPQPEEVAFKKAEGNRQRRERAVEEARLKASAAFDKMLTKTDELEHYFKVSGHLPFCDVRDNSELLFGDKARQLFSWIESKRPALKKQASVGFYGPTSCLPFGLVKECLDAGDEFIAMRGLYYQAIKNNEQPISTRRKLAHVIDMPEWGVSNDDLKKKTNSVKDAGLASSVMSFMNLPNVVSPYTAPPTTPPTPPPANTRPELLAWELSSPDHENDLRSIQVSGWLQDLMVNDPTIGNHSHQDIAKAYNDLSKLAPRTMGNPTLAKTLLGKYLERDGNIDLFDAQGGLSQILDVEKQMKERDSYPRQIDPFADPQLPDANRFH